MKNSHGFLTFDNVKEYTNFLNHHNIDRIKCIHCGEDIWYNHTRIHFRKRSGDIIFANNNISTANFETQKVIFGKNYKLCVCQDCLLKRFPDLINTRITFIGIHPYTHYIFHTGIDKFANYNNGISTAQDKQEYTELLNTCNIDRPKCIHCGEDIWYNHTSFILSTKNGSLKMYNANYDTTKVINNDNYKLCVCQDCLVKRYPELKHKKINNLLSGNNKYSLYAFNYSNIDQKENIIKFSSKIEYTDFLNQYNIDRPKCIHCGEDIWYNDTTVRQYMTSVSFNRRETRLNFNTIKNINGEEFHLCTCRECLIKKYPDISNKSEEYLSRNNIMSSYMFNIPIDKLREYNKSTKASLPNYIRMYGEKEGNKKWQDYIERLKYSHSIQYHIDKYGEKKGIEVWNRMRDKFVYSSSLQGCIERFGEEEGRKHYNDICYKRSYSNSYNGYIERFGEEEGNEKWENRVNRVNDNFITYSNISQKCFDDITESLYKYGFNIFYATRNCEKSLIINTGNIYLDFYIEELKLCIEFNGDCFHANPKIYKPTDIPNPYSNLNAQELWDKDSNRIQQLKELYNIDTIVIWESEYKSKDYNKNSILDIILNKYKLTKNKN